MRDMQERPLCHRSEDLVTYLYGEANAADATDFREHLQNCEACSSEYAIFSQVHDSIVGWRNEVLGASFTPVGAVAPTADSVDLVRHERKLSALGAVREFFSVSPLWLRGATAFAGLLLCALTIFAVSRIWQRNTIAPVATKSTEAPVYTAADFKAAVAREVRAQTEKMQTGSSQQTAVPSSASRNDQRRELATIRVVSKTRPKGLSRQEREQLAADLRLTLPAEEEELLALPDQEHPNE